MGRAVTPIPVFRDIGQPNTGLTDKVEAAVGQDMNRRFNYLYKPPRPAAMRSSLEMIADRVAEFMSRRKIACNSDVSIALCITSKRVSECFSALREKGLLRISHRDGRKIMWQWTGQR